MKSLCKLYLLLPIIGLITSCRNNNSVSHADLIDFGHLATTAYINPTTENIHSAEQTAIAHPEQFTTMLNIMGIASVPDKEVESWINSGAVKGFAEGVNTYAPKHEDIVRSISYIVDAAKHNGLKVPTENFATAIWGRPQSILFADSTMFIALNHYLGSDHPAYNSLPVYRRQSKRPEAMKYDIAEAMIATAYPFPSEAHTTVANRLMYEGAIIMAKMKLVEDPIESEAMGYTPEELNWLKKNEGELWKKMLSSKIIFDSSDLITDKMFAPSPATTLLSADAPGRSGRFIGYQLIKSFFTANPNISLSDYLTERKYMADNPLIGINYNP